MGLAILNDVVNKDFLVAFHIFFANQVLILGLGIQLLVVAGQVLTVHAALNTAAAAAVGRLHHHGILDLCQIFFLQGDIQLIFPHDGHTVLQAFLLEQILVVGQNVELLGSTAAGDPCPTADLRIVLQVGIGPANENTVDTVFTDQVHHVVDIGKVHIPCFIGNCLCRRTVHTVEISHDGVDSQLLCPDDRIAGQAGTV